MPMDVILEYSILFNAREVNKTDDDKGHDPELVRYVCLY